MYGDTSYIAKLFYLRIVAARWHVVIICFFIPFLSSRNVGSLGLDWMALRLRLQIAISLSAILAGLQAVLYGFNFLSHIPFCIRHFFSGGSNVMSFMWRCVGLASNCMDDFSSIFWRHLAVF